MSRLAALPVAILLMLSTPLPGVAAPQSQRPATQAPAIQEPAATTPAQSARQTREDLEQVLDQYGPALPRVLKLDPTLLANDAYLQPYPALRAFLTQHPEIARNAPYYFGSYSTGVGSDLEYRLPRDRAYAVWDQVLQGFMVAFIFSAIFGGVVWLIRTAIEHRRWMRLSKIQTDVHNKLLDRFTSNEELLAYVQTPAGKRFLESAPIALDSPRAVNAPLGRILWSAQLGAVVTIAGVGIRIVAARAIEDVAQPLAAVGVFVIAIGIGFVISAVVAYMISKRLGLLPAVDATADARG